MAKVHPIEAKLSKVYGITRKKGESDEDIMKKLHAAATKKTPEADDH